LLTSGHGSPARARRRLNDVCGDNLSVLDHVLLSAAVDKRHTRRRHTLDPPLEARAPFDGLARPNTSNLAAVPVERRTVGKALAEAGRRDLERIAERNQILDLEQRTDVVVDRDAVLVCYAVLAVDGDAQQRPRPLAPEVPAHELEPLRVDHTLDHV